MYICTLNEGSYVLHKQTLSSYLLYVSYLTFFGLDLSHTDVTPEHDI